MKLQNTNWLERLAIKKQYHPGDIIFQQGDSAREMYCVLQGQIEIYLDQGQSEVILTRLGPGDFLGEMSLLEGLPRSASVRAVENSLIAVLDETRFRQLLAEDTQWAWMILKVLSGRIRNQNRDMSLKLGQELEAMANGLQNSSREIETAIGSIAQSAQEIKSSQEALEKDVLEVENIIEQTEDTLQFIGEVAKRTRMLGLNASIEAAHAKEHGGGFGIVAEEIKKLSEKSRTNAEHIGRLMRSIGEKMGSAIQGARHSLRQTQEQAQQTVEIEESIKKLAQMAENLAQMGK